MTNYAGKSMTMDWCRWHNGTVTDPKWRVIARRAGVPLHMVIALWPALLEEANQATERGTLESADPEDLAAALDMDPEQVAAIMEAMQGKVLDGKSLTGWDKRNPKREREDSSTERVRRYRERNATKHHETPSNAVDKRRVEKKEEEDGAKAPADEPPGDDTGNGRPDPLKEARGEAATLIRAHVWLGSKPPPTAGDDWTMSRDLSVWKQLLKQFRPDEVNGGLSVLRLALAEDLPAGRPITMAYFARDGSRDRMIRCVAYWRRLESQKLAREKNPMALIGKTATEVARAATG